MDKDLRDRLGNPEALEEMFRRDPASFERALRALPSREAGSLGARFWFARLGIPAPSRETAGEGKLLPLLILLCAAAGTLLFKLSDERLEHSWALQKNLGPIFFSVLCALCLFRNREPRARWFAAVALFASCTLYINLVFRYPSSYSTYGANAPDTLVLACVFLPLFLWSIFGLCHAGFSSAPERRIEFLRFNGDLVVLGVILQLSGMLLSGITMALFSLIGVEPDAYMREVVSYGLASILPAAWYLLETRRVDIRPVSRVVARIFSPMALAMLLVYLATLGITHKNPYMDRAFLITFNFVLAGVLALIFFSIAGKENRREEGGDGGGLVLVGLCSVAIALNAIALSAICFRLAEFGTTPNRMAVLGSNLLMFLHLLLIARVLWSARKVRDFSPVEVAVTRFLPAYAAWAAVVAFTFPVIFRFA